MLAQVLLPSGMMLETAALTVSVTVLATSPALPLSLVGARAFSFCAGDPHASVVGTERGADAGLVWLPVDGAIGPPRPPRPRPRSLPPRPRPPRVLSNAPR